MRILGKVALALGMPAVALLAASPAASAADESAHGGAGLLFRDVVEVHDSLIKAEVLPIHTGGALN
ncbi:hypothetical protein GCM10022243_63050 [Saccharothrix violaceirubra]|uniref:Uncharacterized protein n=1 Tax=Saccharothrix violaceirubra TaxID=413306 RepID=A0A7W7WTI6_9PSEU|nr:hypothetical protein [Saccharothrix violaceirubra]MBB4962747.1 hypothetical protein [Saccharothrix violaceirubra]